MRTASVSAVAHNVWHASVSIAVPTTMRQGVCPSHPLVGAEPAEGTAPCWRCDTPGPAILVPASTQEIFTCDHNHRTPEAAEDCGRSLARRHGAKVRP